MGIQLTITSKGQVTLRQSVLAHLGAKPGEKIEAVLLPDGRVELQIQGAKPHVSVVRGIFYDPDRKPATLEDMQEAIESVEWR
jgi:bifunctional DNA-binding transcriptional regulator/antitoxin component of YhaV-PrlF toxin-antitoxin module